MSEIEPEPGSPDGEASPAAAPSGRAGPTSDSGPAANAQAADAQADAPETRGRSRRVATALSDAAGSAASAMADLVQATARRLDERPGARVRRVRRLGREPLTRLEDVHPDARNRAQRNRGVLTIDVADIAGTAVAGASQRGGDFLPLKPFRSANWAARWQRLGRANDRLAILPPIDVLRHGNRYWVIDGHNRVAQALYGGHPSIDADVTELVEPGAATERSTESFASLGEDSRELRSAVSRSAASPVAPAAPPSRLWSDDADPDVEEER
jgi:hypothetical protein